MGVEAIRVGKQHNVEILFGIIDEERVEPRRSSVMHPHRSLLARLDGNAIAVIQKPAV